MKGKRGRVQQLASSSSSGPLTGCDIAVTTAASQPRVLLRLMFQSSLLEPLKENTIKS